MVYKHAVVAAFGIYTQRGEVGGPALNSHGNYIIDHGISWKNHGIVFLNFCGNPDMAYIANNICLYCKQYGPRSGFIVFASMINKRETV